MKRCSRLKFAPMIMRALPSGSTTAVALYATRAPGYHTTPHAHEAEQINYVLEGEILPTGWTNPEGRFGEFTRLMGGLHWNPLVRIKAITRLLRWCSSCASKRHRAASSIF